MNPQFKDIAGSVIRWGLTVLCTWLVQRGVVQEAQTPTIIAAGLAVVTPLLWSIWQKYGARLKLLTALTMAPGATEADVERHIEATPKDELPPVTTPKDVQPVAVEKLP